jgi:hypothetical protein
MPALSFVPTSHLGVASYASCFDLPAFLLCFISCRWKKSYGKTWRINATKASGKGDISYRCSQAPADPSQRQIHRRLLQRQLIVVWLVKPRGHSQSNVRRDSTINDCGGGIGDTIVSPAGGSSCGGNISARYACSGTGSSCSSITGSVSSSNYNWCCRALDRAT